MQELVFDREARSKALICAFQPLLAVSAVSTGMLLMFQETKASRLANNSQCIFTQPLPHFQPRACRIHKGAAENADERSLGRSASIHSNLGHVQSFAQTLDCVAASCLVYTFRSQSRLTTIVRPAQNLHSSAHEFGIKGTAK